MPVPFTHEYSAPDRFTPSRITCWPLAFSSLFPDTWSCGAGPPPLDAISVAVTDTGVNPDALAVNVAAPVPVLLAVIVTFWRAEKLAGVNVSDPPPVTDS